MLLHIFMAQSSGVCAPVMGNLAWNLDVPLCLQFYLCAL